MGIGFSELMVILVIIMIIFGAGKLPEIGSAFGNSIKNFKKSMREADGVEMAETAATSEAPSPAGQQPAGAPAKSPSATGKSAVKAEEDLIDQAMKEITEDRIHTIRTKHDGLVQDADVFTESVKRVPFGMKGRDGGVSRDLF
jgi:sec-independent protein translocase protein TatA